MKPVYVIVIYEKSEALFHHMQGQYLHEGSYGFDTGLELHFLEKIYLIALDVFREAVYHKNIEKHWKERKTELLELPEEMKPTNATETVKETEPTKEAKSAEQLILLKQREQIGWLSLLATETVEEAERNMREYPWLKEIYREMAAYREKPEEVLFMFSEASRIMDQNTVLYMIEEQQKEIEEQKKEIERLQELLKEKNVIDII